MTTDLSKSDIENADNNQESRSEEDLRESVGQIASARDAIVAQVRKRIYGQTDLIDHLLIALFARGHVLLMGVPGLAKTSLVSTLAEALDLNFNRIQFTPDLMPSDITGTDILEEDHSTGRRFFKFIKGPVFSNLLLADEINRTPPKTQAALLQAMQEYEVSAGGNTYKLERPFQVFATQNPIEQEGTYPLPEAQLDRFMFRLTVDYPNAEDEVLIVRNTTSTRREEIQPVLNAQRILELQQLVLEVPVSEEVVRYAVNLVRRTRPEDPSAPDYIREYVSWGAGPRAGQYLILGGKARAILDGRLTVSNEDIRALAAPILRHRLLVNFQAEAQGLTTDDIIARLLEEP
ncbi:AAA family ATPase [Bradymonas sediminis]|uniref:AAA family ATPase n=1 Tax=Bradymonas sediminis TaxID=1548548 RepID=A0A2Z4FQ76_9DELT|nr:MoxR family ATPase [Bradymonas sediminis]AWV90925.1 AAA family ATPase [Bradymonas sediminis]TDP75338.1 MoxR-like ATPase [Bradymonas sediminis]